MVVMPGLLAMMMGIIIGYDCALIYVYELGSKICEGETITTRIMEMCVFV